MDYTADLIERVKAHPLQYIRLWGCYCVRLDEVMTWFPSQLQPIIEIVICYDAPTRSLKPQHPLKAPFFIGSSSNVSNRVVVMLQEDGTLQVLDHNEYQRDMIQLEAL